ncbi:MAG TPA: efflux RND transporter permease subunit, partial [Longimicrobiales bacterium]|nr:efflux RND transporter permease subunit [Longimicrobiales bacterium]
QDDVLPPAVEFYEVQLRWALDHRLVTLAGTIGFFVLTVIAFGFFNKGLEFFPESMPPEQLLVTVEAPVGTRAAFTDSVVQRLESDLSGIGGREDWKSPVATVGGGGGGSFMDAGPSGPEGGRITVSLVDFQYRKRDAFETLAEMQEGLGKDIAGATVSVDKPSEGAPQGAPENIEIVGEDPVQLKELSDEVVHILENAPVYRKLVGLGSDMDEARSELAVTVDREKAALYDLNTSKVGGAIRSAINGVEAAKYRTGNDEYDIVVRLAEPYRQELEGLRELKVMAEGGIQVPLVSMAEWSVQEGYGSIKRKDQTRMATVTSDVAAGYNSNAVLAEVQRTLADFDETVPSGYTIRYTGQSEDQAEAESFLAGAFLTALMLIAFILISQFNSVVKPVIILTSVMMSTVGVLMGLMIFQMPFGIIMTGVGLISLAGIVVNNAIILIDYIDILRDRDGMNRREALVHGGKTRFRPVILTATTTALGLVPLAIGLNFDFFGLYERLQPDLFWGGEQAAWWGPMAVAVIVGILFATFLTLVLVPVMYSLVDDFTKFFAKHFRHEETSADARPAFEGVETVVLPEPLVDVPSQGGRIPAGVRREGGGVRGILPPDPIPGTGGS